MKNKPRTAFKQCNHRHRARVGRFVYVDNEIGPTIWWCTTCGAYGRCYSSGDVISWTYPTRARNR